MPDGVSNDWKAYFIFSKKERIAVFALLIIMCILTIIPFFYQENKGQWQVQMHILDSISTTMQRQNTQVILPPEYEHTEAFPEKPTHLFSFNPNLCTAAQWKQLGVSERTIQTIQKYLAKGGKFKQPADIHKIYGISPALAGRLEPYVQIPIPDKENSNYITGKYVNQPKIFEGKRTEPILDINKADIADWKSLPGIGEKLSARIVAFREKLGGFSSIAQVGATYGLPDSTFQQIKPRLKQGDEPLHQININTATAAEMKQHPYFNWNLANAIVQFRQQHGSFTSIADLQKIQLLSLEQYQKISPYIKTN